MTRTDPNAANWKHSYPYEPGEEGDGAYIRFDLPGYSWTATVTSVDSLANWIAGEAKIYNYTIVRPGDLSSDALEYITTELLAGIEHVYSTPDGRDWHYALTGIRQWEHAEDKAQREKRAATVEVGDYLTPHINQGNRPAYVVAVSDDGAQCIIEYIMPNRRTYLIRADTGDVTDRSLSYLPYRTFGSRIPKWAGRQLASQERHEARQSLWEHAEDQYGITRRQQRNLDRATRKGITIDEIMNSSSLTARLVF